MIPRLLWFVVRLVTLPVWLPFWVLRGRVTRGAWLLVEIDGAVADLPPSRFLARWAGRGVTSLHALETLVDAMDGDPRVRGLLVMLQPLHAGMATATSLRNVLARARELGKEVVVHLPQGGGSKEVYVASAATRVVMGPQAALAPVGFASAARYVKRALAKVGVEPAVLACGEYKSAGEALVRDGMSDAQREQVGAILDEMHGALLDALVHGRGMTEEQARAVIDDSPHRASRAVELGLVDAALYDDELPAWLTDQKGAAPIMHATRYLRGKRSRLLPRLVRPPVIGVVGVHGVIAGGVGPLAMDERVMAALRVARASKRVRGVVLHVDSPGGGALASDRIHHEVAQLAREKPVVACFTNVAASGGYYVAAAAHHVVAQPTTITGSIGVVSARLSADALLDRLGVTTETLSRGARASLLDPLRKITESDREALLGEMRGVYDAFVGVVAQGRKRSAEEIDRVARGRVWTGRAALAHGLVDELGGFRTALAAVRARVGPAGARLEPATVRPPLTRVLPLPVPRTPAPGSWLDAAIALLGLDRRWADALRPEATLHATMAHLGAGERVLAFCVEALRLL